VIWVEATSSTVRGPDGRFGYGVRMIQDVTARKEAENRQKLLVDELNHRVKNTLATVQALAAQTARKCTSASEFRSRFEPRLLALSAAHDRLTRRNWEGASLGEIAREELAAHSAPGRTLKAHGPDLVLSPRASLSLSMALHELATNAVKHGALSVPGGQVELGWKVERDGGPFPTAVSLAWAESGGPPPKAAMEEGFGSRLLRVTAEELKGKMETHLDPAGFRWTLSFPLSPPQGAPLS
jgi:two-component sensor histidine kinase